uniref:Eukaryotic translation initiation factor 4 gamma 3 n=1 Tax=Leptobrachium leishanense TaxID=445787 RepID=A0A8C5Q9N7_9ANUR
NQTIRTGAQTPTVYQTNQPIMMVNPLPMPYPMPQGPQYCISQYRHSASPYVGPPQQYQVQPPGPNPFYPGPGPGDFPNPYGPQFYPSQPVYQSAPIIVPTQQQQQQQPPPPPAKREKKTIRIRDPNQGGKDITEEIMSGGSRNPTPPILRPSSTPTPPQVRYPAHPSSFFCSFSEEKPKQELVLKPSPPPCVLPEPSVPEKSIVPDVASSDTSPEHLQTACLLPLVATVPLAVSASPAFPCHLEDTSEGNLSPPAAEVLSETTTDEMEEDLCKDPLGLQVAAEVLVTAQEMNGIGYEMSALDSVPGETGLSGDVVAPEVPELAPSSPIDTDIECTSSSKVPLSTPALSISSQPESPPPPLIAASALCTTKSSPPVAMLPLLDPGDLEDQEEARTSTLDGARDLMSKGRFEAESELECSVQLLSVTSRKSPVEGKHWLLREGGTDAGTDYILKSSPFLSPCFYARPEGGGVRIGYWFRPSVRYCTYQLSDLPFSGPVEKPAENDPETSSSPAPNEQPDGKRQYDREFLLGFQFMPACVLKPEGLPPISDVVLDKINQPKIPLRTLDTRMLQRGPDFTPAYADFGRPSPGGRGVPLLNVGPRRSQPGQRREPRKIIMNISVTDDVHLKKSENAWKPGVKRDSMSEDPENIRTQALFRKVRSILNKLTPQMFNQLMKQVTDLTVDTEERLKGIIDLVFEKALDEPGFSVAYANMCRCLATLKVPMADKPSNTVNFRKLLLNRCQKEFEKDKADDDVFEKKQKELESAMKPEEKTRLQEELEEAKDKARRRSIGNIKFIGELFKLKMLTEAIMHDCVVKLLKNHDEESLECLCRLLTTIGKDLDFEKAKPRMDQYFHQMGKIVKERKTSSRIRFMLQDVIDLRLCNWVSRRADQGPKTIEQIHKEAKIEEQEEQRKVQQLMTKEKRRPGVQRVEEGGWNTVQGAKNNRVLDPSKFLKITKPMIDEKIQLVPKAQPGSWGKGSSGGAKASETGFSEYTLCRRMQLLVPLLVPPSFLSWFPRLLPLLVPPSPPSPGSPVSSLSWFPRLLPLLVPPSPPSPGSPLVPLLVPPSPPSWFPPRSSPGFPLVPLLVSPSFLSWFPLVPLLVPPSFLSWFPVSSVTFSHSLFFLVFAAKAESPEAEKSETREADKASLPEEEMERKSKAIIDEFLHINDYKEAMQCVEELRTLGSLSVFVRVGVESTLERSQITRDHMGQLLYQLVQSGKLCKQDVFTGFSDTLELADDMAIDIPHIWLYLAELVTPMLKEGGISLKELIIEFGKALQPVGRGGILLSEILHLLCKQMSHKKVAALWRETCLKWKDFLPEGEDVQSFVSEKNLDFTLSDGTSTSENLSKKELSGEELNKWLAQLIIEDKANDEQIFDWVEANLDESQMSSPTFLRALMTAICKAAILGDCSSCRVDTTFLKQRVPVLLKYLDSDTERELQALYALQALIVKLDQPPNLLRMFFDCLYDEEVISEDAFYKWENSKDPAEQNGKGVALKSVTAFFTWLREAEEESEDN